MTSDRADAPASARFRPAWIRFEETQRRAGGTYVGHHTDVLFGEVARHWFDSPHPRWGEQYPQKVRSLLSNWVPDDRITVHRRADARRPRSRRSRSVR